MVREYQIDTLLEYMESWIDARIINMDSTNPADHLKEKETKLSLKEYIMEITNAEREE